MILMWVMVSIDPEVGLGNAPVVLSVVCLLSDLAHR
jgi:hypothetical protein